MRKNLLGITLFCGLIYSTASLASDLSDLCVNKHNEINLKRSSWEEEITVIFKGQEIECQRDSIYQLICEDTKFLSLNSGIYTPNNVLDKSGKNYWIMWNDSNIHYQCEVLNGKFVQKTINKSYGKIVMGGSSYEPMPLVHTYKYIEYLKEIKPNF